MAHHRRRSTPFFTLWLRYVAGELRALLAIVIICVIATFFVASLLAGMYQVVRWLIWGLLFS